MCEFDFLAVVDGSSQGNGAANEGYGSYVLPTRDGWKQTIGLDLGTATNSRADYQTLIAALKDLCSRIQRAGKSPSRYSLLVHTDTQLMVSRLTEGWQVKASNLRPLVDQAATLIKGFGRCGLVKVPREESRLSPLATTLRGKLRRPVHVLPAIPAAQGQADCPVGKNEVY